MPPTPPLPPSFLSKKQKILAQLAVPATEYDDLSPKGSIDEGIRDLIDDINVCEGFVTTSSCAGRISVFAEGDKNSKSDNFLADQDENEVSVSKPAGVGGKGGGGKWLYVSHDPINLANIDLDKIISFLGMECESTNLPAFSGKSQNRLIHFKFEPMVRLLDFVLFTLFKVLHLVRAKHTRNPPLSQPKFHMWPTTQNT